MEVGEEGVRAAKLEGRTDEQIGFAAPGQFPLRGLIKGNVSPRQMTGPLGMGAVAVQLSRRGPVEFLYFMAFISAALAVFNFLPIPVVDGGHAVFLLIEKIRRKPVSIAVQNVTQLIGLVLLLGVFLAET